MFISAPRLATFLFIFSLIIAFSNPADADDGIIFERIFTIGEWHLHASQHTFSANDFRQGILTIGKSNPQEEIQHGFLVLNGTFVFLRDFLAGDELVFEKNIALKATNGLIVFLLGNPGASISMQISGIKAPVTPPQITAFTAEPTSIKRGESATLTWQTANAISCVIDQDIGAVDPSGSVSVKPQKTTSYQLTAEGAGDPATATVTVAIENSAPKADPQAVTTDEDTAVAVSLTASDVDGDSLTYAVTAQPGKGTLSGVPPALTYTPNENYNGIDSFSFKAHDGRADSNAATVSLKINPVNDAPVAVDDTATVEQGSAVMVDVLSNDTDVEGDFLTISSFTQSEHGEVSSGSTGLSYAPDPNYSGTDSFSYTVNDGKGGNDTASVNISIVPVVVPEPKITYFYALQENLLPGEKAILKWSAVGDYAAIAAHNDSFLEKVPLMGEIEFTQNSTGQYTLTVSKSGGGLVSETVTVYVSSAALQEPPNKNTYAHSKQQLIPHDRVEDIKYPTICTISGLVVDPAGNPISDVFIIVGDGEAGSSLTAENGEFAIGLNGGKVYTLYFKKDGYPVLPKKVDLIDKWELGKTLRVVLTPRDTEVTTIEFGGNPEKIHTHVSGVFADGDGERIFAVVIPDENMAYMGKDKTIPLPKINVRVTELTVGESGPDAMLNLPFESEYTSAFDLSVDEIEGEVYFDNPVWVYQSNYLGFPVGFEMPVGIVQKDTWKAQKNAIVVSLLDTDLDGICDSLDINGDSIPDDLNNNGMHRDEANGLGDKTIFKPGDSWIRWETTHFSTPDFNPSRSVNVLLAQLSGSTAENVVKSNQIEPATAMLASNQSKTSGKSPCPTKDNSWIGFADGTKSDVLDVPGAKIAYFSGDVPDYQQVIMVRATEDEIHPEHLKTSVRLEIAGRSFEKILEPPEPNQTVWFTWDGLDSDGSRLLGPIPGIVEIINHYRAYYANAPDSESAWARPSTDATNVPTRRPYEDVKRYSVVLNQVLRNDLGLGWGIFPHNVIFPNHRKLLFKWNGERVLNSPQTIDTYAKYMGTMYTLGSAQTFDVGFYGNVVFTYHEALFELDDINNLVALSTEIVGQTFSMRIHPKTRDIYWVEDGGYVGDTYNFSRVRVRMYSRKTGEVITVAGTGESGDLGGIADGILATEASFRNISSIWIDEKGLFIVDVGSNVVYEIYEDFEGQRRVRKFAGVPHSNPWGEAKNTGDGGLATEARLWRPRFAARDPKGNTYIVVDKNYSEHTYSGSWNKFRKVTPDGIIQTVDVLLGNGSPLWIDSLDMDSTGHLLFLYQKLNGVYKFREGGKAVLVAGGGYSPDDYGDGGHANKAGFSDDVADVRWGPDRTIWILDGRNGMLRVVGRQLGIYDLGDFEYIEDREHVHLFNASGLHKKILDFATRQILWEFVYDSADRLIEIFDRFGRKTTIERNPYGTPAAIISPEGQRTTLVVEDDILKRLMLPDGSFYVFEYSDGGLMTKKIDPNGNEFSYTYDENGRLLQSSDQEGGFKRFIKSVEDGKVRIEMTKASGWKQIFIDSDLNDGSFERIIETPNGLTEWHLASDALSAHKNFPCGNEMDLLYDVDISTGMMYTASETVTTPGGLSYNKMLAFNDQDLTGDKKIDILAEEISINGKIRVIEKNLLNSKLTAISPEGRTVVTNYNPETLLAESVSIPDLHDTSYQYSTEGKLVSIKTSARETKFTYDALGHLGSVTDPENHVTKYITDPLGRIERIDRSDGSSLFFDYDLNGNMALLVNPAGAEHGFTYNKVDLNNLYEAPLSGSYLYEFNPDRQLTKTTFPSGKQIINTYEDAQLIKTRTPEGDINYTYSCASKVEAVTKGYDTIAYGYDGSLVTSEIFGGTLNQDIVYGYNNDFNLASMTYAGVTVNYAYDNDALLIGAGSYAISRNAENGLPKSVSGGALNLARVFNGYGEMDEQGVNVGGRPVSSWNLTRDNNGRIIQKTEIVGGVTANYSYTYDPMGRLLTVGKDGALVEEYSYAANGTRIYEMNGLRGISGRDFVYSEEDHLLTVGDMQYEYDPDGFLTNKADLTDATDKTQYVYSSRGELLRVTLLDGRVIEYIHDHLGRRIAKKIAGVIIEKYLWQGMTRLLAVYDGADNLLMRFEYADDRMPIAVAMEGAIYYLTYDQVGSLRLVAASAGNVVKRIDYDSFGNIIADTNEAFKIPIGFAGGLHDRDTGLVRFGFRDYDPDAGRWTAKDPIFFAGGDTDLYGYVLSDPINLIDPEGLKGGIIIPIRNFIKRNVGAGDVISPIIEKGLSIPTSTVGILIYDFLNPKEAGVGNEAWLIYQWEREHYPDNSNLNFKVLPIEERLILPYDDVVIKAEPCD